jgi:hypothetical protein
MGLFDRFLKKKKPEVKAEPKPKKVEKTEKELANERGEPWVAILSMDIDPENLHQGAFELDWNDKFVANLVRAGYQGKPDDIAWIAGTYPPGIKSQNDISGICMNNYSSPFCGNSGAYVREVFNIGTDRTIAISGAQGGSGATELMQYYPTVERANTVISSITVWLQVGKKLLLAGTDKGGKNLLSLYDPETFQETLLLDASNEIEIYNLGYVASANKVMFNGLSFSNGQYVVGDIPL